MKREVYLAMGIVGALLINMGMLFGIIADIEVKETKVLRAYYLPSNEQIAQGIILKNTGPICLDAKNSLIVGDWNYCTFYKFDLKGKLISSFGKKGQGPSEFMNVQSMFPYMNEIACNDNGNMRVMVLNSDGVVAKSFKTFKAYSDMASDNNGLFYASPNNGSNLVDIIDQKGKIIASFGKKIKFNNEHSAINKVTIRINKNNDILIAWKYFPFVRHYSSKGELLSDGIIDDVNLKESVKANNATVNAKGNNVKISLMGIIHGFYASESRYYVLIYGGKPKILEYALDGQKLSSYELNSIDEDTIYVNIAVKEEGNKRTFYVVQGYPEARVDVFMTENHLEENGILYALKSINNSRIN